MPLLGSGRHGPFRSTLGKPPPSGQPMGARAPRCSRHRRVTMPCESDVQLNRCIALLGAICTVALLSPNRVVTAGRAGAPTDLKTVAALAFERNDGQHDRAV